MTDTEQLHPRMLLGRLLDQWEAGCSALYHRIRPDQTDSGESLPCPFHEYHAKALRQHSKRLVELARLIEGARGFEKAQAAAWAALSKRETTMTRPGEPFQPDDHCPLNLLHGDVRAGMSLQVDDGFGDIVPWSICIVQQGDDGRLFIETADGTPMFLADLIEGQDDPVYGGCLEGMFPFPLPPDDDEAEEGRVMSRIVRLSAHRQQAGKSAGSMLARPRS